jgi:hypothetical protein
VQIPVRQTAHDVLPGLLDQDIRVSGRLNRKPAGSALGPGGSRHLPRIGSHRVRLDLRSGITPMGEAGSPVMAHIETAFFCGFGATKGIGICGNSVVHPSRTSASRTRLRD